ncbi:glycosyltransferase [Protaetiibacter intestinalis]|uniref:Glycosyltransferase n=1 Tax=Protaetiibacter intestinalis TaxID=2419774 RepID=A0A387BAC7_9MICO|nr:glycosyltransferase [Protaetiibacter intestinalis]
MLVVTAHAGGNTQPVAAVIAALARRGCRVRVLAHPAVSAAYEASGAEFLPYRHARPWSPLAARPGIRSMLGWLGLASDRGIARDVAEELAREPADVVLVDCMVPVALAPARASGATTVLVLHAFSRYWTGQWRPTSPMGAWLRVRRAHPARHPADLAIVLTDPGLDPVDPSAIPAAGLVQAGPVLAGGGAAAGSAAGRVVVSFSTISYPGQREALQRTLDAVGALPVDAVVTLAPSLDAQELRIPANVERRGFTPHAELLPGARLLVGHGGHGTTMAALAAGVPVLVVAMSSHADQPLVGEAVARAGVGESLHREASVAQLRAAIERLLGDEAVAARAARLGERLRDADAAERAASAVLAAASG